MLSETMLTKLNEQIGLEFYSSNYYLQMSSWCGAQGFEGAAGFFRVHSQEELTHMYKVFDYVNDHDAQAVIPALDKPPHEFESLSHVFRAALDHEHEVTAAVNERVGLAFKENDFATFNFLQWFVAEQREEETLFQRIVDMVKMVGKDGHAIYMVDREIGKLATAPAGGEPAAGAEA